MSNNSESKCNHIVCVWGSETKENFTKAQLIEKFIELGQISKYADIMDFPKIEYITEKLGYTPHENGIQLPFHFLDRCPQCGRKNHLPSIIRILGEVKEKAYKDFMKDRIGYVYVVKLDKHYKIGISKTPESRLKEFTLLPYELETIILERVIDYDKREKELHEHFADKRVRGEWFLLDNNDIEYIKNYLKQSEEQ